MNERQDLFQKIWRGASQLLQNPKTLKSKFDSCKDKNNGQKCVHDAAWKEGENWVDAQDT